MTTGPRALPPWEHPFAEPAAERFAAGRAERDRVPLEAHAELAIGSARPDPLAVLAAQDVARDQTLVPIRYGRMMVTPFTFLRGSAAVMAADLAPAPRTVLQVQLCGDAHLANFGVFAAPDRRLVFDVNDFDETLPGPFEWDVKRLGASIVVAARENGFTDAQCRTAVAAALRTYRETIAKAAAMDPLAVWYFRVEFEELVRRAGGRGKKREQRAADVRAKAGRKDNVGALAKLTEVVDGKRMIVANPPLIVRPDEKTRAWALANLVAFRDAYRDSMTPDRHAVFDRYAFVDYALKVVGVGSVGTRCLIVLMMSGNDEPLFLQLKEATASVLEEHLGPSASGHPGQRVVDGQQVMQSASDVFLGWATYERLDGATTEYYVRQLWDGKASARIDRMGPRRLADYASACGLALARAHARSGDSSAITGYLGDDDTFDRAVLAWSVAYADQTEVDHRAMVTAVEAGDIVAVQGE